MLSSGIGTCTADTVWATPANPASSDDDDDDLRRRPRTLDEAQMGPPAAGQWGRVPLRGHGPELPATCDLSCSAPTCLGRTACDWDGSPCAVDEFCNYGVLYGSCEKCSDEELDRGLPRGGGRLSRARSSSRSSNRE